MIGQMQDETIKAEHPAKTKNEKNKKQKQNKKKFSV